MGEQEENLENVAANETRIQTVRRKTENEERERKRNKGRKEYK
jgi:hypothetical protein